ncbi:MAG TPA: hypothetical protein VK009_15105 [Chloroflexota bacterium]|nr:hypothetical protein [Chloroflexota bacterium]
MIPPRSLLKGIASGMLVGVAALGGLMLAHPSGLTSPPITPTPANPPAPQPTLDARQQLLAWDASNVDASGLKDQVMDQALAYFGAQNHLDPNKLRQQVVVLGPDDYNARSVSYCEDAAGVHSGTEAWLLDIRADKLFVNDGFTPATKQTAVDLFFRYLIGLYNLAPRLKTYPEGVPSSDGVTAYYEKGLVLLGRRKLDQLVNTECFLPYRLPIQNGFTADRAMALLDGLGLAPAPDYAYPQKPMLLAWRSSVAPKLGPAADSLLEPFLQTDSGAFYRQVGRALGDDKAGEATADRLFRAVFPGS